MDDIDEEAKLQYTQDYLRQLEALFNTAIDQRYCYLQLVDDQLDEGFSLQCHYYRSKAFLLGSYAGAAILVPSILLYVITYFLEFFCYQELTYIFIVAGLSTYFILRALNWTKNYTVRPCQDIGGQVGVMIEKFKSTNSQLAQELHGLLSSTSSIIVNTGAREFLEKCIVFGVQFHGKALITLESLSQRHITLYELEQLHKCLLQGTEWLLKGEELLRDITSGM